jgi:hypothetical protein
MALVINGRACSWSSISLKAEGIPLLGITELTYGDSVEEAIGYGLSAVPSRRSYGRYQTSEGSIKGFASDIDELVKLWAARSTPPGNWSGSELTLCINFAFTDSEPLRTHTLNRVRLLGIEESFTEGPDLLMGSLKIRPMTIERDSIVGFDRIRIA